MRRRLLFIAVGLGGLAVSTLAQNQVGPVYPAKPAPQSAAPPGYDPFQLDWSTGRFRYVPIPYDQTSGSASPYQFNAWTGNWDYVPAPAPSASPIVPVSPASPPVDQSAVLPRQNAPAPQVLPQQATHRQGPATQPLHLTTAPTTDPLHLNPKSGHWEYDPVTKRWQHVLPPD